MLGLMQAGFKSRPLGVFLTSDNTPISEPTNALHQVVELSETRLLDERDENVIQYLKASLSDNSIRAYRADIEHFVAWGGCIPATPECIARYLAEHGGMLSTATLSRRLVSISKAHAAQGHSTPTQSELVKATLKGIRRVHGTAQRQTNPILKADIAAMADKLPRTIGARDRALLLVGFAGAFRRSELVALQCADIEFVEQGMVAHIRHSKTDQEGAGRKVAIPYARDKHCPVLSLKAWLGLAQITEGSIFRSVNRHGQISKAALSSEAVAVIVKKLVLSVGLDPKNYAGHSLRAGLVTSAAQAGVSSWKIRAQTGHKSDAMLNRYIRDANLFVDNAAGGVL